MVMDSMTRMMLMPTTDTMSRACQEKFTMRSASCGTFGATCAAMITRNVVSSPTAMPHRASSRKLA